MLNNLTRHARNLRLAAFALIAVCFFQPGAYIGHAAAINIRQSPEVDDEVIVLFSSIPVGLAPGQTLRINVSNANKQRPCCTNNLKQIGIAIHNYNGDVIARSDEIAIQPGQFHSFDFNRDDLPLIGEAGTGRIQVRAEIRYRFFSIVDRTQLTPDDFPNTLEVIDKSTGQTVDGTSNTVFFAERIARQSGSANESISLPDPAAGGHDSIWIDIGSPLGIVPGQTLRISVLNPLAPAPPGEDGRKYKMLVAVTILDARGQAIAHSDEITLNPGEFHSFDFKRTDLPLTGESGTGRLQVRSEIRRRFFPGIASRIPQGEFPGAVELIDSSSGKTMLLLPAVQAARDAARPPASGNP
jgi:hypothetical protein